ncbi:MAG: glycosyltransferase family 4 protein [Phycisphaerae bacterium]|nr:glycosyltransferase family 4 protein [Phycisphaerae bacterium]
MNVALVIERMDPARGGRERSTAQIARALAARGHDVDVLCQSGVELDELSSDGPDGGTVTCRPLGRRGATYPRRLERFVADVRRATADGAYGVVHATLPIPGADVYQPRGGTVPAQAAASLRRRCLPARAIARATKPLNRRRAAMRRLEAQVMADPRVACLAVSRMVAREMREHYGRRENVHVVYNAVDAPNADDPRRSDWRQQLRFRLAMAPRDTLFLTVARNLALKGVDRAIEAFTRWLYAAPQRAGRLIVVGGERTERYRRHAGLRDVGRFVGFVEPTETIFRWYAAADVCVLLSWYDPCSRVVLEATRWGIPSITTASNGAGEVLTDGAGIVVDSPRDVRAVAEAMGTLSDRDNRADYEAACRAVAPRLSTERHVDRLIEIYRRGKR